MARKIASSPFSAARRRSATVPRLNTPAPGSDDPGTWIVCWAISPSSSESVSGMPGFLEDRIVQIGPDDLLELRIYALGRLQVIGAVDLDHGFTAGLVALGDLVALGGDRGAPVLGQIDAGVADRLLGVGRQRVELGLARHHDADVVDLIGQVNGVD